MAHRSLRRWSVLAVVVLLLQLAAVATPGQAPSALAATGDIVLSTAATITVTAVSESAVCNSSFGIESPINQTIFPDTHTEIGQTWTSSAFPAGTSLVFWFTPHPTSFYCSPETTYLSTDSSHAHVQDQGNGTWGISWNDSYSGDQDFNDLVVQIVATPSTPIPAITTIVPKDGPITGGTPVTITGSAFTGATAVSFGGTPATYNVDSDTQITATSPAHAAGTVDVTVTTPGGTSALTSVDQFTYVNGADLALTMTAAPNPVVVGSKLTYTLTVANNGPDGATGVAVTDSLPAGVSYDSSASSPTCGGTATITCAVGNLANSASTKLTLVVTASAMGTVTNTASVTANEADPNPENNVSNVTVTIAPPPVVRGAPYDFVTAKSGYANCNYSNVDGSGAASATSDIQTGDLGLQARAWSPGANALARAGVGVEYTAPVTGRIRIDTAVTVVGNEALWLLPIRYTGVASFQSWVDLLVWSSNPSGYNLEQDTLFASQVKRPTGNPISMPYTHVQSGVYSASMEVDVTQGQELFICAGVKTKVVAVGLVPLVVGGAVGYGVNPSVVRGKATEVQDIRITYVSR
ncbi:MAG TPA: IPT/TIG domain-containing protein [Streptosporangiaceae bacterium]|nr:IPT/TIG domain-containing protein [Streptosporangiaceae bacterium]